MRKQFRQWLYRLWDFWTWDEREYDRQRSERWLQIARQQLHAREQAYIRLVLVNTYLARLAKIVQEYGEAEKDRRAELRHPNLTMLLRIPERPAFIFEGLAPFLIQN